MKRKKKTNARFAVPIVVCAAIIGAAILFLALTPATPREDIDYGIDSDIDVRQPFIHWHPYLAIVIDGEERVIPANIGITGESEAPIHTHDATGILHIEQSNPSDETLRLGYFFAVWNETFNAMCVLDACANATHDVKFFVNGGRSYEFENYRMQDLDLMLIVMEERDEIVRGN